MMNAKGFSLTELIVGLGISVTVALFTVTTMGTFVFRQQRMQSSVSEYIDKTIGERILLLDLRNADPSFNNITYVKDKNNLGFFDYFPDVPASLLPNRERSLTLAVDKSADKSVVTEIFFLVLDLKNNVKPLIIYDPIAAYVIGPVPTDFNQAASLTYMGLNNNNFLSAQGGFWTQNKFYMLDTPARFRPVGADSARVPPRSPIFVGMAQGKDLVTNATLTKYIDMSMPWEPSKRFTSADNYLRHLPPNGGGQTVVRLKAVKLIRYYVEAMSNREQGANFYRQELTEKGFEPAFLVANKVRKVEFSRRDVTNREISFGIEKMPQN